MNIIDVLNWRYATKKFDSTKEISKVDLDKITEIFRLTPSSYGLQAWKLIVVKNRKIREKLLEHSYGQRQVLDSSILLVLARPENISGNDVDKFMENIVQTRGIKREDIKLYEDTIKGTILNFSDEQKNIWIEKQIYIALGNLITSCSALGIDSCPMEGFIKEKYDEVLGLKEKGLKSVVILPIGYRSENDEYAKYKKVRFPKEEVILEI